MCVRVSVPYLKVASGRRASVRPLAIVHGLEVVREIRGANAAERALLAPERPLSRMHQELSEERERERERETRKEEDEGDRHKEEGHWGEKNEIWGWKVFDS